MAELTADAVWTAVLEAVADKAALTWIRGLQVVRLTGDTLHLVTRPGQRDLLNFVTAARRDQLAGLIETVTNRRVRIELAAAEPAGQSAADQQGPATDRGAGTFDRGKQQAALELPLVREVMDVFRDATLIGVAREYNDPLEVPPEVPPDVPPPPGAAEPPDDTDSESEDDLV